jgi:hypothetical protein
MSGDSVDRRDIGCRPASRLRGAKQMLPGIYRILLFRGFVFIDVFQQDDDNDETQKNVD